MTTIEIVGAFVVLAISLTFREKFLELMWKLWRGRERRRLPDRLKIAALEHEIWRDECRGAPWHECDKCPYYGSPRRSKIPRPYPALLYDSYDICVDDVWVNHYDYVGRA